MATQWRDDDRVLITALGRAESNRAALWEAMREHADRCREDVQLRPGVVACETCGNGGALRSRVGLLCARCTGLAEFERPVGARDVPRLPDVPADVLAFAALFCVIALACFVIVIAVAS